uniref:Uncharacterized protein n=1 Tax=Rhizophora mucronata TaxID=61149 RepID=A0A2P2QU17_RHIMU
MSKIQITTTSWRFIFDNGERYLMFSEVAEVWAYCFFYFMSIFLESLTASHCHELARRCRIPGFCLLFFYCLGLLRCQCSSVQS